VDVPTRPKGTIALSPFEPRLQLLGAPHQGNSAQVVRLLGANFSTAEKPTVWFGARKATVLQVVFAGGGLDVAPPKLVDPLLEDGALVDVAVVNPDGQAVVMPNYFRYSVPEPAVLAKLTPGTASVYAGDSIRYGVELTRPAPLGGVTIRIATTGAVGATPPAVTIGSGGRTAGFTLVAAQTAATGRVEAVYADVVLLADVTVVAKPTGGGGGDPPPPPPPLPDEIDVSGWTVLQAASARTFTIPAGTKLKQGETLVIGRAATQTAFAAYWGVTFGADVRYLTNDPTNSTTSTDDWPSINGSESFELRDASGATVDGPTAAMGAAGGEDWQRSAGLPAGQKSSWTVSASVAPGSGPTPGAFLSTATAKHGVFISEFADTAGSGNYVYEFVELHFDGLPSQ
jgi:hypothetical protein